MSNTIGWGKGAQNNTIGWGNAGTNGFGSIYERSNSGETLLSAPSVFQDATVAYSLRDLNLGVTSNVVRVRRSSDNLEQDFTATQVTDGTLTSFCGAGDGFVSVWYDQTGVHDASQGTALNQPKIVSVGDLVLDNGKPALDFNGNSNYLQALQNNPFSFTGGVSTIYVINKKNIFKAFETIISAGTAGSPSLNTARSMGFGFGNNTIFNPKPAITTDIWFPSGVQADSIFVGGQSLISYYINNWSLHKSTGFTELRLNNTSLATKSYETTAPVSLNNNPVKIGVFDTILSTSFFEGNIQEIISYKSDKLAEGTNIETNINDHYAIY